MRFRRRYDRERFVLLCLWLAYGLAVMVGCSAGRWSPTDPQVDFKKATAPGGPVDVIDRVEIPIGGGK